MPRRATTEHDAHKYWAWFKRNATAIGVIVAVFALIYTIYNSNQQFELFKEQYIRQYGSSVIQIFPSRFCTDLLEDEPINFDKKVLLTNQINICNRQGVPAFVDSVEYRLNNTENPLLVGEIVSIKQLLKSSECILLNRTRNQLKPYSNLTGTYDFYSTVYYISTDKSKADTTSIVLKNYITLGYGSIYVCK